MPELLIDRSALLGLVNEPDGNTVIVDARERKRYRGDEEPIDRVAGHIPGAVCYPWQDTTTADGRVISAAANRECWSALSPTTPIVVYCGSGVSACVDILSLQRAGFRNVKLYVGSWSDWCSYRISRSRPATSLARERRRTRRHQNSQSDALVDFFGYPRAFIRSRTSVEPQPLAKKSDHSPKHGYQTGCGRRPGQKKGYPTADGGSRC